jgi:DNA-binding NtrC family response regulator
LGQLEQRILVVLPEVASSQQLVSYLREKDYEILWVKEGQSAYEVLDTEPVDAIISELRTPRIDGLRLMSIGRSRNPEVCPIMIIGGPEDIELGVEAMRQGAYDFQMHPLNLEKILAVLGRGITHQQLVGEVSDLRRRLDERYRLGDIARRSTPWQRIYEQIEKVAQSKASILITGETGTGKGEVAKAIHQCSRRRDQPFVEVNCGALPEGIVESELFGHEKGAFTGAANALRGRFERADHGTLFLDEIGDLPLGTQVKLLRALQTEEFERIGSEKTYKVDLRFIAATHRNLNDMVVQRTFREDLFYRLQVVTIDVPSLRECREDIPILVNEFIKRFAEENEASVKGISSSALDILTNLHWPGNVRELKNCIEGMVVMAPHGRTLETSDIPSPLRSGERVRGMDFRVGMSLEELEKEAIVETLKAVDYDRPRAAKMLKVGLSTLYRKEKEYGLEQGVKRRRKRIG